MLGIATNLPGLNTTRNLKTVSAKTQTASERLSSGLRINRAADDAAGLAISQKMRAQIRGLNRAQANVDEGINLIQTADGAMNEVNNMLSRMRELSVQAANDTNSLADRQKIQNEIAQLTSEINTISENTNYNTRSLFNGSVSGNYGYEYGLKTTPFVHTPASVEATDTFQAPLEIPFGTAASTTSPQPGLVDLRTLTFPDNGTFSITVMEPTGTGSRSITQTLDFGTVNPPITNITDFENYFKNKFNDPDGDGSDDDKIADFSIVDGKININTATKGGSGSTISISGSAYSSIIGYSSGIGSATHDYLLNGGGTKYTSLDDFWNDIKGSLAGKSNTFQLWGSEFVSASNYDTKRVLKDSVTINYSDYSSFSALQNALQQNGLSFFLDRNGNVGISPTTAMETVKYPGTNNYYGYYNSVAITGSTNNLTGLFGNATSINNNSNGALSSSLTSPPSSTSSYPANVSDYFGLLEFTVANPYGAINTCSINFSAGSEFSNYLTSKGITDRESPAATNAMVDFINEKLNINKPNPAAYNPPSPANYEVARAYINGSGRLVVQTTEKGSTVIVNERASDEPMYNTSSFFRGIDSPSYLNVVDDFGNQSTITFKPTNKPIESLDEFISANRSAFKNAGWTASNVDGKLVITSIGEGKQYTVNSLNAQPAELIAKLGLGNAPIYTDGTSTPISPDDPDFVYNGLWIQSGANEGQGLWIDIPRLSAYDLGLSLYAIDMLPGAPYNGISKSGADNYVSDSPNVEAPGTGTNLEYGLDVSSHTNAAQAVGIIDNAVNIISSERSILGAKQNRLEHTKKNLGTAYENLVGANSKLEDADMAKEMMEYTKGNILSQAGMSMLAQANQRPQNILSLMN